jgi:hypothetical protein
MNPLYDLTMRSFSYVEGTSEAHVALPVHMGFDLWAGGSQGQPNKLMIPEVKPSLPVCGSKIKTHPDHKPTFKQVQRINS